VPVKLSPDTKAEGFASGGNGAGTGRVALSNDSGLTDTPGSHPARWVKPPQGGPVASRGADVTGPGQ